MTVLVTGANGYLGAAVVSELLTETDRVRCLVRPNSDLRNLDGLSVELTYGDVRDPSSLEAPLSDCKRVIHLAAVYANWLPNPKIMYDVNVTGTQNVLAACQKAGVEKVVYCSSTAALGAHGKTPANESASFNLEATRDHYYSSKHQAEQIVCRFADQGLPVTIVNPTNPIGPGDLRPTPTGALLINVLKGKLPGYVDGGINLVGLTDCARGHILALQHGKAGERYILGHRNVSIKEYFDLIVQTVGRGKSPSMRLPVGLAVASAHGYELLARLTGRPPLTSASWVRVGSHYAWWDSSKAVGELGLPQTPIEDSIRAAAEWFAKHGYI